MKLLIVSLLFLCRMGLSATTKELPKELTKELTPAVQSYVDALHKKDEKALKKAVTPRFLSLTGLDTPASWNSLSGNPPARAVIDEISTVRDRVFVRFHLESRRGKLSLHDGTWFSLVKEGSRWKIDTREHDFHP